MTPAAGEPSAVGYDADHELGRSIVALLLKEPFYGHLLGGVVRRIDEAVGTAGVALMPTGVQLIVNPRFMAGLSEAERTGTIKHEALHLVFRHPYRPLPPGGDRKLFNVAADLVVNQLVEPWPLPDGAITLESFPSLELPPDQTVDWYYERLVRARAACEGGQAGPASSSGSGSSQGAGGKKAGSTQGAGDKKVSAETAEELRRAMEAELQSDHRHWAAGGGSGFARPDEQREAQGGGGSADPADTGREKQGDGAPPELTDALRRALEGELERHLLRARDRTPSRYWGDLPAEIQRELDAVAAGLQPQVDWRRTLRLFAASGFRTRVVPTKRRMSKRFATYPGLRIRREQRVCVAVDTSGSIGEDALALFFTQIRGIWRAGAEVTVVECDAEVQRAYRFRGRTPAAVEGGGGTTFGPVFAWLRDGRHGRYDACIYLTDGFGPAPKIRPPCPVLWVLTDAAGKGDHLTGGRVLVLPS